jgi:hypothetical protein
VRFARLRNEDEHPAETPFDRVVFVTYNVVWWIPVVLTVLGMVSYEVGLVGFLAVTTVRALVNLYRNNVMPVERAQFFPLRSP